MSTFICLVLLNLDYSLNDSESAWLSHLEYQYSTQYKVGLEDTFVF